MTGPRCKSQIVGGITVKTLVVASLAAFALPALASTVARESCSSSEKATLAVSPDKFVATTVSHDVSVPNSEDPNIPEVSPRDLQRNLLAPRAEAAIREAFEDSESRVSIEDAPTENDIDVKLIESVLRIPPVLRAKTEDQIEKDSDSQSKPDEGMKTVLPGIADDELSQFKKVMFRRDI